MLQSFTIKDFKDSDDSDKEEEEKNPQNAEIDTEIDKIGQNRTPIDRFSNWSSKKIFSVVDIQNTPMRNVVI